MAQESIKADSFSKLKRKLEIESLWLYIAHILRDSPATVAEIKKKLKYDYGIPVTTITLYTVLYRMEKEGLVNRRMDFPIKFYLTAYGSLMYRKGVQLLEEKVLLLKS